MTQCRMKQLKKALKKCGGNWVTAFYLSKNSDLYIKDIYPMLKLLASQNIVIRRQNVGNRYPVEYKVIKHLD